MPKKNKTLDLKREDFTSITQKVLGREKTLRFKAKGISMSPLIKDGDILEIAPVNRGEIRVGDVIFYRAEKGRTVAHRVIERIIEDGRLVFLAKGDSNVGEGEEVHPEKIMGRVRAIERNGRKTRIDYGLNRLMRISYLMISPSLVKTRRVAGKLVRHVQSYEAYRNLAKRLIRGEIRYRWESCRDSTRYLLARRKGNIIGRITINEFSEADAHYRGWWIFGTWVAWQYRGLGVASRLTEMLCEFARKEEASEIKLLAFKDSKPALNLYRKLGFYRFSIPQIDKELREEAKKTRRRRIIMKKDL